MYVLKIKVLRSIDAKGWNVIQFILEASYVQGILSSYHGKCWIFHLYTIVENKVGLDGTSRPDQAGNHSQTNPCNYRIHFKTWISFLLVERSSTVFY